MILQLNQIQRAKQSLQRPFTFLGSQLALPHIHRVPPHALQSQTCFVVTFTVSSDFMFPKLRMRLRHHIKFARLMLNQVPVPKTTIDKDTSAQPHNGQVGRARQRLHMNAVAKTMTKQKTTHQHFRTGILRPNPAHTITALLWCHLVCHVPL